jgi:diguanylate cyclase (GGDEF)-like protein
MNDNQSIIAHILYLEQENSKETIFLEDEVYSIGRESDTDIRLNSPTVSRHHATLIKRNQGDSQFYLLIDGNLEGKRSQNGILVNGKIIIKHLLKHGDTIFFGNKNIKAIYQRQEVKRKTVNEPNIFPDQNSNTSIKPDKIKSKFSREELQSTLVVSEQNLNNILQQSDLSRLSSFPELSPNPIVEIDRDGNITYSNPAAKLNFEDLSSSKLKHPLLSGLIINKQDLYGKLLTREIKIKDKVFEQYVHYLSEHKLIRSYIFDITQRKKSEEMLRYQSLHDSLTGLPNRDFFYQKLTLLFRKRQQSNKQIALFFIDLDRFKNINETLNHSIGDLLIQEVSIRLLSCLTQNTFISRWGGDEFTIIISDFKDLEEVETIAGNLKKSFKKPFFVDDHTVYLSASIGISIYPRDAQNEDNLIQKADAALYRVKELGRNNYQFYITQANPESSLLFKLENSLHKALENNQLFLCYQPQINTDSGEIHGLEALLRWEHPDLGPISPSKFIPLAEETGLIIPIGEWILETVCRQNKAWQDAGLPPLKIAVNLSALQFQQDNFTDIIFKILEKTKLDPQFLELEITEGLLMQDVKSANKIINNLADRNVTFSLDDFGTGYSSLSYLKKFPFHTIKIDKSFIQDLKKNKQDLALISAIISLANGFDMNVIAEGVETKRQLNLLTSLGCKIIQGWIFSNALKTEDVPDFIRKNSLILSKQNKLDEK